MKTRIKIGLAFCFVLVCVSQDSVSLAEVSGYDLGPPSSPVTINPDKDSARRMRRSTVEKAMNQLGLEESQPSSIDYALYSDQSPFGVAATNRPVFVLSYSHVPVNRAIEERVTSVTVNLVFDAKTNELLAAFTNPRDRWVQPVYPARDPEEEAAKDGWTVASMPAAGPSSSVVAVLETVWNRFAIDPSQVGQIVLRPRMVANEHPSVEVNGQLQPVFGPRPVWIVHVLGTIVDRPHSDPSSYWSGAIMQFDDRTLEFIRAVLLP